MRNFLTTETSQGFMDIFIAAPESKEKAPVVIVLQEAFGVNHHIRSICERLAQEGFLAAAPELYHREGKHVEVDYSNRPAIMPLLARLTNQGIIQDVRETINFLDNLPGADLQNISVMGFCVGGFASALVASKLSVKKMVSFYGAGMVRPREGFELKPIVNELPQIKAKSLLFFGGQDASIPLGDREAIQAKLHEAKVPYDFVVFDKSDHGFFCDERKSFDEESAKIAWEKTLTFLKK